VFIAGCALFVPGTPYAVIFAILLIGGFFRSLQFTSINTLAYAEVEPARMSRATTLTSVAQQLAISAGVAVGALVVDLTLALRGGGAVTASDFQPAFLVVGLISAASALVFAQLPKDAGAELANRTPVATEGSDQRMG